MATRAQNQQVTGMAISVHMVHVPLTGHRRARCCHGMNAGRIGIGANSPLTCRLRDSRSVDAPKAVSRFLVHAWWWQAEACSPAGQRCRLLPVTTAMMWYRLLDVSTECFNDSATT